MKKITLLFFIVTIAFTCFSWGQSSSNKKYSYNYLNYPETAVGTAATFNITIHSGNSNFTDKQLKGNKAKKTLRKYTSDDLYFSFKDLKLTSERPDINVEIAFGKFQVLNKIEKAHEIACTYKGAKLNSTKNIKKNLKMCPAVYYKVEYQLPYILKISNQSGDVLLIKEYNKKGWDTFGYDSTGLTGFLKKEDLDVAYNKSDLAKIKKTAYLEKIAKSNTIINENIFFKEVTDQFKFGTGKDNKFDYSALTTTLEKVLDAFKNESEILSTLEEANILWEKEIATVNLGDKKARINRKIATSIYGNLALSNMYLNNFEKANEYSKEYVRLANMAIDQSISERARAVYYLIKKREKTFKINKDLALSSKTPIPAPRLNTLMNDKKSLHKFVTTDEYFTLFSKQLQEIEEQKRAENAKNKEEEKTINSNQISALDKYRNRIQSSQLQGNVLFLNNWYDKDIEGKELPKEICELTELNELRPYGLSLISIPEEIGNLINLKKLNLSGNNLKTIPSSIGKLLNLVVLDLSNNNLEKLPLEIKQLQKLQKIKLKGNNFSKSELVKLKEILPKGCKIKS